MYFKPLSRRHWSVEWAMCLAEVVDVLAAYCTECTVQNVQ